MAQIGHDKGTTLKIVRQPKGHADDSADDAAIEADVETVETSGATMNNDDAPEPALLESPAWISHDDALESWDEPAPTSHWPLILNGALLVLALGWTGFACWAFAPNIPLYTDQLLLARDIAYLALPLVLFGLLWLIINRSSYAETRRLEFSARKLQREAAGLDNVLATINSRINDHNNQIREQAGELASFGEDTVDRLATTLADLARERDALAQQRAALDEATSAAEQQMQLLLHALPKAVEQSRSMTGAMETAGGLAQDRASALEGQLSALTALARDTQQDVGAVAQKLAAQIGQIETASQSTSSSITRVSIDLNATVDTQLERTISAADDVRRLISEQAAAIVALSETSRNGLADAANNGVAALQTSLDSLEKRLATLDARAADAGAVHKAELEHLADALDENIRAVASLHERGTAQAASLSGEIGAHEQQLAQLLASLELSHGRVANLVAETGPIEQRLSDVVQLVDAQLPQMVSRLDELASENLNHIQASLPELERAYALGQAIGDALDQSGKSLKSQARVAESLAARTKIDIAAVQEQINTLNADLEAVAARGQDLAGQTGPQLLEALMRVRETAEQAADKARQAIIDVIPQAMAELSAQSNEALSRVLDANINDKIGALRDQADTAVDAAQKASERLMRQMLTIADTTAMMEQRLNEAAAEREHDESDNLSRRVAMLIEALNSTSIDVTKLLSNDVTDTAWSAYLKGDRGVFTRRAVRLLDSGEARSIQHHYNDDPEFREQVNRYIHDFEAMLRQVLATRDGQLMSVTLLSSDMGKLYVALAQAIERLRS